MPRGAEPRFLLQAFLNRLHASALAARQSPHNTAPLAEGCSSKPPPSREPTTSPSEPGEADSPTSLSQTLQLADPASQRHSQAAAETVTQLGGGATMALSTEDQPAVEKAAAPLSWKATSPGATSPLNTTAVARSVAGSSRSDGAAVAFDYILAAEGRDAVVSMSISAADAAAADANAVVDADAEPAGGVDGSAAPDVVLSLEWLRSAPPDVAAAFLMSVEGNVSSASLVPLCTQPNPCGHL